MQCRLHHLGAVAFSMLLGLLAAAAAGARVGAAATLAGALGAVAVFDQEDLPFV
jgi:hypothetical protein